MVLDHFRLVSVSGPETRRSRKPQAGIFVHVVLGCAAVSPDQPAVSLDNTTLQRLDPAIAVPVYDRSRLRRAIVHVGVGGFHRAHLAVYVNELCRAGHLDWSIVGAGVMPGDVAMADALGAQDHLYSLITRGPHTTDVEVMGSIVDFILAAESSEQLVATIADPATQVVSLTVTEGGYPVDDLTGEHLPDSPIAGASSAFGIIAAGLQKRRENGGGGLTVLSCDNILSNGAAARTATLGEAERLSSGLVDWITSSTTFPNSMVDRITPATTDADRSWLADTMGLIDRWPVVTEPFRQWVVEDNFAADRLPVEELDVLSTSDVEPYELMKLRLLNAAHSCLAYLAALGGIETVDTAMADPQIRAFTEAFLAEEALPVLPPVSGVDLDHYTSSLIERFSNPAIGDQIARLCLDGSAKFPKFLLPTVRAQLVAGGSVRLSALALAGWCEYLTRGRQALASDPLLDEAVAHADRSRHDPAAYLRFAEVFGNDLPGASRFVDAFVTALERLRSQGLASTITDTLQEVGRLDDGSRG